ncbi:MAG: FKBP-type peptidyl-prolyl cis-trans isomerase N-terminal domain-containing protein [Cyclobacteriaceae bacterium]
MRYLIAVAVLLSSSLVFAQSKKELEEQVKKLKAEIEELKKPKEINLTDKYKKAGYSIGVLVANNIKSQGGDSLDLDALAAAIRDVYAKNNLKIAQQECMPIAQTYMTEAAGRRNSKIKDDNRIFLETNKKSEGVKVTASGLQYKVVTPGAGKSPTVNDKVTVHYTGKLIDGTIFDSSMKNGQPATFGLTQVISGWTRNPSVNERRG